MHAHWVDILNRADDDAIVRPVADHFHLVLLPAQHQLVDLHLADRRGVQARCHDQLELLAVVGDAAAGAAQRERRPDYRGQADLGQGLARVLGRAHDVAFGQIEPDLEHGLAEQAPVLRLVDGRVRGTNQLHAHPIQRPVARQRHGDVERGLPAHGRQERVGALSRDDLGDDRGRDRLDVGHVRRLRVGHDRGRVGIDQDHPVAFLAQRLAGLRAGIVELAGLADHDRPGADDQDRAKVGAFGHGRSGGLDQRQEAVEQVARVHRPRRSLGMVLNREHRPALEA